MQLGLENKLVLVTGSTKGIGKCIAEEFLQNGARVIVNGRNQKEVESIVAEFNGSYDGRALALAGDLSTPDGEDLAFNFVSEQSEPLYALVNNVGIFEVKNFFENTDEDWDRYFQINVMSAVRLSRRFLKGMIERKCGRVLMISSEAGVRTLPLMVPYSVSKTAMIGLARGLAEVAKGVPGVTVNSVLAGPTWTEVWKNQKQKKNKIMSY